MKKFSDIKIWIRGAGELGSATAHLLHRIGFSVFLSELENPLAIRRPVTFSDAIFNGFSEVEGARAKFCSISKIEKVFSADEIPILIDNSDLMKNACFEIYIDARMLKTIQNDSRNIANISIGLGPGFTAKNNCDVVIETMRGHNLGKVIWDGSAQSNTGIPGNIGGKTKDRIIKSPANGTVDWLVDFGEIVQKYQALGKVGNTEILTKIHGIVRGLIYPKVAILDGMKIGDVDPRGTSVNFRAISEKSRCIARGVLEAILINLKGENG
ncbi:MAG: EF2563 family selenium-dependent molybdenum hydroxylase system protein [Candidatus Marinimicrobia bacterium]|nr:EF2563 family selenium-dependent molybdenum hydroxylase system protein [Candidatus Neomarinimicrobiota bacterium]MBL7108955.1 EF2563 family selenium-dependent molybdenum hydroxylase system protein [Candidatus Neomarinimicrobiota bacterium]